MPITLNASTSSGLITTPDNSGAIALQNNGTTGLNVSAAGIVTMPNQPVFGAYRTAGDWTTANSIIVFNTTTVNRGTIYSTSTGLFTAPVTGVYYFACRVRIIGGDANMAWRKNGSTIQPYWGTQAATGTLSSIYVDTFTAGDTFGVIQVNGSVTIQGVPDSHNFFTGYLIG